MHITLVSFGFKHGPEPAEFVWDVRFLPNPHWVADLRPHTGREERVADYVLKSDSGARFLELLLPALRCALEESLATGKRNVRFAIGCTGGRHRSVALVEHLGAVLHAQGYTPEVHHRDIDKE